MRCVYVVHSDKGSGAKIFITTLFLKLKSILKSNYKIPPIQIATVLKLNLANAKSKKN
jgi:hypothetical protein